MWLLLDKNGLIEGFSGMGLGEDWMAVSLGTSDTLFLWLKEPKVVLDGHVLCNPLNCEDYMGMLWYVYVVICIVLFCFYIVLH